MNEQELLEQERSRIIGDFDTFLQTDLSIYTEEVKLDVHENEGVLVKEMSIPEDYAVLLDGITFLNIKNITVQNKRVIFTDLESRAVAEFDLSKSYFEVYADTEANTIVLQKVDFNPEIINSDPDGVALYPKYDIEIGNDVVVHNSNAIPVYSAMIKLTRTVFDSPLNIIEMKADSFELLSSRLQSTLFDIRSLDPLFSEFDNIEYIMYKNQLFKLINLAMGGIVAETVKINHFDPEPMQVIIDYTEIMRSSLTVVGKNDFCVIYDNVIRDGAVVGSVSSFMPVLQKPENIVSSYIYQLSAFQTNIQYTVDAIQSGKVDPKDTFDQLYQMVTKYEDLGRTTLKSDVFTKNDVNENDIFIMPYNGINYITGIGIIESNIDSAARYLTSLNELINLKDEEEESTPLFNEDRCSQDCECDGQCDPEDCKCKEE